MGQNVHALLEVTFVDYTQRSCSGKLRPVGRKAEPLEVLAQEDVRRGLCVEAITSKVILKHHKTFYFALTRARAGGGHETRRPSRLLRTGNVSWSKILA